MYRAYFRMIGFNVELDIGVFNKFGEAVDKCVVHAKENKYFERIIKDYYTKDEYHLLVINDGYLILYAIVETEGKETKMTDEEHVQRIKDAIDILVDATDAAMAAGLMIDYFVNSNHKIQDEKSNLTALVKPTINVSRSYT